MGSVEETSRLLEKPKPVLGVASALTPKVEPRSWRYPLWQVCGDGAPQDVAAGCLAWQAPAVAFSWNMHRALQRSFWRELLKIVLVLGGAYVLLSGFANVLIFTCDQPLPVDGLGTSGGMPAIQSNGLSTQFDTANAQSDNTRMPHHKHDGPHDSAYDGPMGEAPRKGCRHAFDLGDLPAECRARVMSGFSLIAVAGFVVIIAAVMYAARRREQIREQFGIEGTFRGDFFTWLFCPVCSLAQETRTLMSAQVHDGVWYGPLGGAANTVPAAQQMV